MYIIYMYSIQYSAVLQYSMNSIVHTYYLSTHDTVYGRGGGGWRVLVARGTVVMYYEIRLM